MAEKSRKARTSKVDPAAESASKAAQKVVATLSRQLSNLREERIQELTDLIAARVRKKTEAREANRLTLADAPFDYFDEAWSGVQPHQSHVSLLAQIDKTVSAAKVLHELIERDQQHVEDAEGGGAVYDRLPQRYTSGLHSALSILLLDVAGSLERMHNKVQP